MFAACAPTPFLLLKSAAALRQKRGKKSGHFLALPKTTKRFCVVAFVFTFFR